MSKSVRRGVEDVGEQTHILVGQNRAVLYFGLFY